MQLKHPSCPCLGPNSTLLQFSDTKSLPGGERGVCQLAASLDIGKALVLSGCDVDSLRDPNVLPQSLEAPVKKKSSKRLLAGCSWCAGESGGEGEQEVVTPAPSGTVPNGTAALRESGAGKPEAVGRGDLQVEVEVQPETAGDAKV
jgi:hypothetical protein